jgi:hypothetical protein
VTSRDENAGVGTSVGNGSRLIVNVGADDWTGVADGDDDVLLFVPNMAQPPTVAASDAAVSNTLTPGAPAAGRLAGLVGDMLLLRVCKDDVSN